MLGSHSDAVEDSNFLMYDAKLAGKVTNIFVKHSTFIQVLGQKKQVQVLRLQE
jgi:hypothetical protein